MSPNMFLSSFAAAILVALTGWSALSTEASPVSQFQISDSFSIEKPDPYFEVAATLARLARRDEAAEEISFEDIGNGLSFLRSYGYLPQPDMKTGQLLAEDVLLESIRNMQRYAGLAETGILDEETIEKMNSPRCGMSDGVGTSDRAKRYAIVAYSKKWPQKRLTYRIQNFTPQLSEAQVRQAVSDAWNTWAEVTPLQFVETTGEADLEIFFASGFHGDGAPFDGPGRVLAHAYYPGNEAHPAWSGDAHFDGSETWTNGVASGSNFFQVAVHEFGHSLGLLHSSDVSALMFPYYSGYNPSFSLPDDDRIGIQFLYGPPEAEREPDVVVPDKAPVTEKPQRAEKEPECYLDYDAISILRGELFMFSGNKFWRGVDILGRAGWKISDFWNGAPERVDAVYERSNGVIVMLSGDKYYEFNGNVIMSGSEGGKSLSDIGLPSDIDAAMVWGLNGLTYMFKGDRYWRFDDKTMHVNYGYPKDVSNWKGIPNNVDSAVHYSDGNTYFFKGEEYWKFDNRLFRADPDYPKTSGGVWMACDLGAMTGRQGAVSINSASIVPVLVISVVCTVSTYFI